MRGVVGSERQRVRVKWQALAHAPFNILLSIEGNGALAKHGKLPLIPHVAENVQEARALFEVVKAQDRDGAAGIVQAERALARLEHGGEIPPEAAE